MQPELLLYAVFFSMLPWAELRLGIPYAMAKGVDPLTAFVLCVAGNVVVIPFIFLFLKYLFCYIEHVGVIKHLLKRTRKKSHELIERYGYPGLLIFVAIPWPGTGAYTGSLVAYIFGMNKKKASLYIAGGVVVAGIIVTFLSMGVLTVM